MSIKVREYSLTKRAISPMMSTPEGRHNPGPVDVIHGLGTEIAKMGDKVRIKYQLYSKHGKVEYEKGPVELILGEQHYGQGFDDGIRGMKVEGTRELKIPPNLCPQKMSFNWKKMIGLRSKEKEIFYVTLLAILESKPKDGTQQQEQ